MVEYLTPAPSGNLYSIFHDPSNFESIPANSQLTPNDFGSAPILPPNKTFKLLGYIMWDHSNTSIDQLKIRIIFNLLRTPSGLTQVELTTQPSTIGAKYVITKKLPQVLISNPDQYTTISAEPYPSETVPNVNWLSIYTTSTGDGADEWYGFASDKVLAQWTNDTGTPLFILFDYRNLNSYTLTMGASFFYRIE